jgi:hypothetical protein
MYDKTTQILRVEVLTGDLLELARSVGPTVVGS